VKHNGRNNRNECSAVESQRIECEEREKGIWEVLQDNAQNNWYC